ncbi:hypothetical protein F511_40847 [Dorcoceras hygrometricum]|uniref:Uncharacterized protein n=1 Tax=Dorcoceras hygrometricum TaxID=472368 RepID=A0A2Z7DDG3_9LAMI|nr:hypothetical protein F511_40847 [Dorcoceras hygrometricum]
MADPDPVSQGAAEAPGSNQIHREFWLFTVGGGRSSLIRPTTRNVTPSSAYTRRPDEFGTNGISSTRRSEQVRSRRRRHGDAAVEAAAVSTCVTLNGSGIQLAVGTQPLWLRNRNFGLAQRIMVKRLETSPHDPLGIQLAVGTQPLWLRNRNFGLAQRIMVKRLETSPHDPLDSIGYPRMKASGESSTTKHRLLHASGPHPIPPPNDPKTNQYNQDLGLIHLTNGNHLECPNEGSSIDHQVTIHLHAQNITMFPTNETWYFTSQMLVSSSGGLILILTVQSTRNGFRIHSDY